MNRKAHWIRHTHIFKKDEYECSFCGHLADMPGTACPHCASLMKGQKYDPSWVDELEKHDAIFND